MLYLIYIEGMMKVEGMTAAEIAEAGHGYSLLEIGCIRKP